MLVYEQLAYSSSSRDYGHVYITYSTPRDSQAWFHNACIVRSSVISGSKVDENESERILNTEANAWLDRCRRSVPCIADCGRRWAKHASVDDGLTTSWRNQTCTRQNAEEFIRRGF